MSDEINYNKDIFAGNLRELIRSRGERQTAIARLLGVSRSSVSAYCGGIQMPRMDKLQKLSGHFGVTLRELIESSSAPGAGADKDVYIKHYIDPAAAGYASPVAGEDYEFLERSAGMPKDADFCITVHGDSMSPYINDGELVYVKRDAPLEEFDVGIFYVDGDIFCKQWCVDYTGTLRLLSANSARQSANITIPKDSGTNCVCFGKVLLNQRLPRPVYY